MPHWLAPAANAAGNRRDRPRGRCSVPERLFGNRRSVAYYCSAAYNFLNKTILLDCEYLAVPAGVERELVVGDNVGTSLDLRKVREAQHGGLRETKQLRRGNTTMTRNNLAVVRRQHRIHEAEALDRRSNLLDLCLAVAARIARIGF